MRVVAEPDLAELRVAIDGIDEQISKLIAERVRLVLAVGDLKRKSGMAVYDPDRERKILERLCARAVEPMDAGTVRRIFERVIDESRRIEQHHVAKARETG